jgi:hypothetical protein
MEREKGTVARQRGWFLANHACSITVISLCDLCALHALCVATIPQLFAGTGRERSVLERLVSVVLNEALVLDSEQLSTLLLTGRAEIGFDLYGNTWPMMELKSQLMLHLPETY